MRQRYLAWNPAIQPQFATKTALRAALTPLLAPPRMILAVLERRDGGGRGTEAVFCKLPCHTSLAKLRSPEVRKELWSTLIVFRDTTFSSTDTGSNKPYPPHVRDFAEARHRARRSGTQVELEPRAR